MNRRLRSVLAIVLAGIWINASEFLRNELWLKDEWLRHFHAMGLVFPSAPLNAAVWGLWGLLFALAVFWVTRTQAWLQSTLICWLMGFVLMWLVVGNLAVLPFGLLVYAVPLSLLETWGAVWLCLHVAPTR